MTAEQIISAALSATGVTREQLFSASRTRKIADCRKHVALLATRWTRLTVRDVADALGVTPTAAWRQGQAASDLYQSNPHFRRQHDAIVETLLDKKAVA